MAAGVACTTRQPKETRMALEEHELSAAGDAQDDPRAGLPAAVPGARSAAAGAASGA
jgi:hypothetical protein